MRIFYRPDAPSAKKSTVSNIISVDLQWLMIRAEVSFCRPGVQPVKCDLNVHMYSNMDYTLFIYTKDILLYILLLFFLPVCCWSFFVIITKTNNKLDCLVNE